MSFWVHPKYTVVSAYAPLVNSRMEEKNDFWEDLDGLIESISKKREDSSWCRP